MFGCPSLHHATFYVLMPPYQKRDVQCPLNFHGTCFVYHVLVHQIHIEAKSISGSVRFLKSALTHASFEIPIRRMGVLVGLLERKESGFVLFCRNLQYFVLSINFCYFYATHFGTVIYIYSKSIFLSIFHTFDELIVHCPAKRLHFFDICKAPLYKYFLVRKAY